MTLFLAGTTFLPQITLAIRGGGFDKELVSRVNMLESFYYIQDWQTNIIHKLKSFMLDSGAFTAMYGAGMKESSIPQYVDNYIDYINRNDVELFFEMDLDNIIGLKKVKEIRAYIEEQTNKRTIPVWHVERGKQEWLDICDEYDYVAIGGIAVKDGRKKVEPYIPALVKEAHKRGAKVHGLGYTNVSNLPNTGFDSVDSTAWLYGNRGGFVYRFNGRGFDKEERKGTRLNAREAARHNFLEWVKFSEYTEKAL